MRALLLAAGKATRLGELSRTTPKCLHRIGDETLLDRIVRQLMAVGVEEFLINTHHLADRVSEHVASAPWGSRAELVHETELLGTLGTLRANNDFFGGGAGWVLHADNFISGPLSPMLRAFEQRRDGVWGVMLTFTVKNPQSYGVVQCGQDGLVQAFWEKSADAPSHTASAATFLFDPRALEYGAQLPKALNDLSRDLLPRLVGRLLTVSTPLAVIDIGTPAGLAAARSLAQEASETE